MSKSVATVTTNDEHVRLRIYDGVIPPDKYHQEMFEAERGQHRETTRRLDNTLQLLRKTEAELTEVRIALAKATTGATA